MVLTFSMICASPFALAADRLALELHENLAPVLTAKVDGAQVQLQFDLGNAHALVLHQGVLDSIKAVPTGQSSKLQGMDGFFEAPLYKVARVEIGTQVFTDVIALLDIPRKGYEPSNIAQGFLGPGLLKPYQLVLDYQQQAMTLIRPSDTRSSAACEGIVVPFSSGWRGEPVTKAKLDRGEATLWWDTGAPVSVVSTEFANKLQFDTGSSAVESTRLILGATDFGPWRFEIWNISLPGFDGFIGHDFFAKHVVCIDFPQNRAVIVR